MRERDPCLERLAVVTDRMRQQVFDAGSTSRIHEEDVLEAARLVDALRERADSQPQTDDRGL